MVRWILKIVLISAVFVPFEVLAAAPKAKQWSAKVRRSNGIPRVVFVSSLPAGKRPSFVKTNSLLNQQSFVKIVSQKNADMAIKLNRYNPPKNADNSAHIKELHRLLGVTQVVVAPSNSSQWTLYSYQHGKVITIGSHKKPARLSTASLSAWIAKMVRYQGIVVASRGGYILVATYKKFSAAGTQAVAVSNSVKKEMSCFNQYCNESEQQWKRLQQKKGTIMF